MTLELDSAYFEWLYNSVATKNRNPDRSYWLLAEQLHKKEFLWFIPNDDNRCMDGKDLRRDYTRSHGIAKPDPEWLDYGCSMLEMLVALSRRASFQAEGAHDVWFWRFIENLGLRHCSDSQYLEDPDTWGDVDMALDRLINRTYHRDGSGGGLFPIHSSNRDQRKIEIWYQLAAYLIEDDRFEKGPDM